jgi:hypothetical protein
MNSLELEFLFLVNFTLHVSPDVYEKYTRELSNHAQQLLEVEPGKSEGGAGEAGEAEAMIVDNDAKAQGDGGDLSGRGGFCGQAGAVNDSGNAAVVTTA